MEREDLLQDPRYATRDARVRNHVEVHDMVSAFTRTMTTSDMAEHLTDFGVPNGPVREPADALRDPSLLARGETTKLVHPEYGAVEDIVVGGLPIRMSGAFTGFDKPAVKLGASNLDVYGGMLGLDTERLETLARNGVI
jgi:crotonobetainyl-CoA:carnitine CoA-transferase CaiB-like acyl-CoA transferase